MAAVTPAIARRRRAVVAAVLTVAVAAAVTAVVLAAAGAGDSGGPAGQPPRLVDLWRGDAALVLDRKWTSAQLANPGTGGYGAHVEVVGATWYLFNRTILRDRPCAAYGASAALGTQVRASSDQGRTWSAAVPILTPEAGTPWACAATDGDAAYDARTRTWRYLYQCLPESGPWQGCLAERRDPSPQGAFTPVAEPVIAPGALWGPICDDPGDACSRSGRPVGEEGTFNVIPDGDGGWWVGFHGFDGRDGLRGLARTRTFRPDGWSIDGAAGTPAGPSITAADAQGWREQWAPGGPVGPGAGALLEQDGAFYQLVEVPDVNLICTKAQAWNLGLLRTRDLASTRWEQWPGGNPIAYSSRADIQGTDSACNVLYPGLFEDGATTYLMHGRVSSDPGYDGIYVYRLEWDRNRLENGDARTAAVAPWAPLPGTDAQLDAPRLPDRSPDGTPYLAFNCGAACEGGEAVYQDVPVARARDGDTLAVGATLRAESGTGTVEVAALQLDAEGAIVESTVAALEATDRYARARETLELDDRTRTVRVQLVPRSAGTFWADNVYLIPQDGCTGPRYPAC